MSQTQSTQYVQREIYSVTRSEATWLVKTYMNAKKKGADGGMEPYRIFRDELETAKPAYLGKFNNSSNAAVQGTFYKIATNLYKMLNELNKRVSDPNHHEKTMDAAKLLPCKHAIAYLTGTFLNWSVYNWYKKGELIEEDLGDNGYETNSCAICEFTGHDVFYFSTVYGLEKPVCERCLPFDVNEYNEEEGEYVMSDEEESEDEEASEDEESEADASACETDDDDEDYKPSCESEAEQEEDDLDSTDASETDASETDASASETEDEDYSPLPANVTVRVHRRFETPSPLPSASEASDSNSDSDDDGYGSEKSFGCSGCNYEWKAGYKYGYKTAMKEMRNYADDMKDDAPSAPRCAKCDMSHESLKKCGGCKLARYCSEDCQEEDWPEHKRVCRR